MLCEEIDMKLYIIANRLPVKVADTNGTFVFSRSEGGLATGLDSRCLPIRNNPSG